MARKEKPHISIGTPGEFQNPFASLPVDTLAFDTEPDKPGRPDLGRVILRRETHPGSPAVIIIDDFEASISTRSLQDLAEKLQIECGCDGAIDQRTIQIRGTELEKVRDVLEHEGFCVAAG